jgi:hypothetical protein
MKIIFIVAVFAAMIVLVTDSNASDMYLNVTTVSRHHNRDAVRDYDLNEVNPGVGIEYQDDRLRIALGQYRNSVRKNSTYALAGYSLLAGDRASIGIIGGLVTGYDNFVRPAAGMIATYQIGSVGANLLYVPNAYELHPGAHGFTALQLRFRL